MSPLVTLALRFMVLSLIAVGGVNTILPEVHRIAVEVHHWVSDAEFTQLFVIARAAPGPNMLLVTLIGWQVAGLPGALVATAATCLPSCTLSYFAVRVWQRFRGARWRRAVEAGLAPITIGLVLATGWLVARGAQASWMAYAVTAPSAALVLFTRVNALWLLAGAAALGLLGLGRRTRSARPACRCSASIPIGSGSRCRRLWPCSSWPDSPGARGRCVAGTDRVVGARRLCSSPGLLA